MGMSLQLVSGESSRRAVLSWSRSLHPIHLADLQPVGPIFAVEDTPLSSNCFLNICVVTHCDPNKLVCTKGIVTGIVHCMGRPQ